jgi:uncharacterized protein YkwD
MPMTTLMQWARQRRLIVVGVLAAVGVVLLVAMAVAPRPGAGAAMAVEDGCPGAGEPAAQRSIKQLQRSIRCLINLERGKRDLGRLARDKDLQEVGLAHSEVMVETNCLAHQCAGEEDLETRLREAGYFDGAEMWQFAENTGCALSAEAMVANWMATRFHRVNILERRFHEIGVGAVEGRVKDHCKRGYATFVVVLGWHDGGTPRH